MIKLALSHRLPAVFDDEPVIDETSATGPASIQKNQFNKTIQHQTRIIDTTLVLNRYSDRVEISTGTPGPMVEDSDNFFR